MVILKAITTSVGWLAGSLAAISALLGGCGFIIVRSQSNLLGLGDFLQYSSDHYVIEGAQFLLYTTIVANETVLRLGTLVVLVFGIPAVIMARSRWWAVVRARWQARVETVAGRYGWLLPALVMVVMFYLFFARLVPYLDDFKQPMAISDLLADTSLKDSQEQHCRPGTFAASDCIRQHITLGQRTDLESLYFSLFLHYLEAGIIFSLVWRLSESWPRRILVRLPFATLFLAFSLVLPMCYGVLVKPVELSPLRLRLTNGAAVSPGNDLYILQKSGNAFIAWSSRQRQIIWYPAGLVAEAAIGARQQLFPLPLPATEEEP